MDVVAESHLAVTEAMHFFHDEPTIFQPSGNDAAAASAKIGCKIYFFVHAV